MGFGIFKVRKAKEVLSLDLTTSCSAIASQGSQATEGLGCLLLVVVILWAVEYCQEPMLYKLEKGTI